MGENLIEGIGDDVTYAFAALFTILAIFFAWWSTRVRETEESNSSIHRGTSSPSGSSNQGGGEDNSAYSSAGQTSSGQPQVSSGQPQAHDADANANIATDDASSSSAQNAPPEDSQNSQNEAAESFGDEQERFTVRLKYLDDTQRNVFAFNNESVTTFRRRCFTSTEPNVAYRMIFRGRLLRDGNTLASYGVVPSFNEYGNVQIPVIHCFPSTLDSNEGGNVSQPSASRTDANSASSLSDEMNMNFLFMPLFGLTLMVLWYICIFQSHLFTLPSMVNVVGLTCFYVVLLINQFT